MDRIDYEGERADYQQQSEEEELTPLQEYRRDIAMGKEQDEKDRAFMKIWRKAWKDWADKEKL